MSVGNASSGDRGWLRPLVAIGAGFVVLTIASIAVVVIPLGHVNGPAAGPEQGFRTFVAAVNNQTWETADQYLSVQLIKSDVSSQSAFVGKYNLGVTSLTVVRQAPGSAELSVYLAYQDESGFHQAQAVTVEMVAERNVWKVDSAFWTQFSSY